MKSLRFKKLWLVSETARAARKIEFNLQKTLLVGKNHTGKSTVVKHIFRTLGCETKGKNDRWDNLAISVLEFDYYGKSYTAYRRANVLALRDDSTQSIRITTKNQEWTQIIAETFDFRLMLPTHQDTLAQATPPFLFLPFYLDQDGSWLHQWNSFDKLSQFAKWKKPLTAYVTGQRPNGYYVAKFEESKANSEINLVTQELNAVRGALTRVKKSLPQPTVSLDVNAFKQEISNLLRHSTHLKNEQESLRKNAFEYANLKETLTTQIAMGREALREIEGDLKYLTETEAHPILTCPTCGSSHENGFPVRLELIDDAMTLRKVIAELEADKRKVDENINEINGKINRIKRKSLEIQKSLQTKKGMLRLQDIVDSQSAEVVRGAFNDDIESLSRQRIRLEEAAEGFKKKVLQFDLPERTKGINELYSEKMQLFASELGVQDLRDDIKKKPDATLTASGSLLPRSLLAYQYAVLHTAKEKGDTKLFPVVVDSPNQQGQDREHLMQMLQFIVKRTPDEQQLILAVEEMPKGFVFDGEIIELLTPFSLLKSEQYDLACNELGSLMVLINNNV